MLAKLISPGVAGLTGNPKGCARVGYSPVGPCYLGSTPSWI